MNNESDISFDKEERENIAERMKSLTTFIDGSTLFKKSNDSEIIKDIDDKVKESSRQSKPKKKKEKNKKGKKKVAKRNTDNNNDGSSIDGKVEEALEQNQLIKKKLKI